MQKTLTSGLIALTLAFGFAALPAAAQETAAPAVEVKDFTLGSPDAKVKIAEYASFTCSHCANFHETVFKSLKTDYIDTGKVQFTAKEVYFDRYGLWAAMIARCGGDMKYFGISDILFTTQSEWPASDDPTVVVENLKKIGRTAGMEDTAMDVCMKDSATAQAMIDHSEKGMTADEVQGTPTLMINGVKHSNMDYTELKAIIDAELAK
jgi:protein-disulfide isomerase